MDKKSEVMPDTEMTKEEIKEIWDYYGGGSTEAIVIHRLILFALYQEAMKDKAEFLCLTSDHDGPCFDKRHKWGLDNWIAAVHERDGIEVKPT